MNSNEISLRWAVASDFDTLGEVFYDAIRNGRSLYTPKQQTAWAPAPRAGAEWHARLGAQQIIVAQRDGDLLGFMSLTDEAYVDFAYIRPGAQGTGLFRRLYNEIEAHALRSAYEELSTHASRMARPAFIGMGFTLTQTEYVELGGETFERFAMAKKISASNSLV